jgi:hypothetical protein
MGLGGFSDAERSSEEEFAYFTFFGVMSKNILHHPQRVRDGSKLSQNHPLLLKSVRLS